MQKRGFWVGLILIAFITLGCWVSPAVALTQEQQFFNEAWRIVNRAYIDETFNHQNWWLLRQQALKHPLKDRQATYSAIDKMLGTLGDPFTRLLKPDQYHSLQVNTSGELTGVGLQIALDEKTHTIEVIAPIEGSPAEQAGILPHDIILEIDGVSTTGLSLDDAAARMRGPIGSRVTLSVQRHSDQPAIPIQLVRDRISLNPVYADRRMNSNQEAVGYIRLSQFNANATSEVAHAISTLEKQGVSGYILDLRNNPGGLLQAGIEIARLWINTGTIVYTVNRQGILGSFDATQSALTDKPLIVLVNQGTASASEILAGALQDNGRALLVGEKTFGKGLIQSLFDLSDGSGLAITVAKYETPNHRDIHKQGIVPDKVVTSELISRNQLATEVDDQYQVAVEMLTHPPVLADAA